MERDTYVIEHSYGGWTLRQDHRSLGIFDSQADARRAARVVARMSRKRGRAVEVLIYDGQVSEAATLIERLICGGGCGAVLLTCTGLPQLTELVAGALS